MNKYISYLVFLTFFSNILIFSTENPMEMHMRVPTSLEIPSEVPSYNDYYGDYYEYEELENTDYFAFNPQSILSQLPESEQKLIKDAVILFSINKQKMFLEFRPVLEQIIYTRDSLRLELTILFSNSNTTNMKEATKEIIQDIIRKEQEMINIKKAQENNLENLRSLMKKDITNIINEWLSTTSVIPQSSLSDLFKEAEEIYDKF